VGGRKVVNKHHAGKCRGSHEERKKLKALSTRERKKRGRENLKEEIRKVL